MILRNGRPLLVGITSWTSGTGGSGVSPTCQSLTPPASLITGDLRVGSVCSFIQSVTCIGVCVCVYAFHRALSFVSMLWPQRASLSLPGVAYHG